MPAGSNDQSCAERRSREGGPRVCSAERSVLIGTVFPIRPSDRVHGRGGQVERCSSPDGRSRRHPGHATWRGKYHREYRQPAPNDPDRKNGPPTAIYSARSRGSFRDVVEVGSVTRVRRQRRVRLSRDSPQSIEGGGQETHATVRLFPRRAGSPSRRIPFRGMEALPLRRAQSGISSV